MHEVLVDGRMHARTDRRRTNGRTDRQTTNEQTDGRTPEKRKIQSVSQTIDLAVTIKTHTESSKSELSSRGKRAFKVSTFKEKFPTDKRTNGYFLEIHFLTFLKMC